MSLYLLILILSFIVPATLSFDSKLRFWKMWPSVLPAIIASAAFFITADIFFTEKGIWGFNPRYHSNVILAGLPLEEWLFFILIPYSCLFIHYVYRLYSGDRKLTEGASKLISFIFIAAMLVLVIKFHDRTYTLFNSILTIVLISVTFLLKKDVLSSLYISFLIMLVPFFLVNAILTGTFIENEVVWYSKEAITGARILTIPVEDFWYSFNLVLMNLLINESIRNYNFEKAGTVK
jgi:lycopene cyclase domain-containing protein